MLTKAREAKGLTQGEVAELLSDQLKALGLPIVKTATYSEWEREYRKPAIERIDLLCRVLGLPLEGFLMALGLPLTPPVLLRKVPRPIIQFLTEMPEDQMQGFLKFLGPMLTPTDVAQK